MITHGNLVATAAGVMKVVPKLDKNDTYIAYLPLAHVFELEAEVCCYALSHSPCLSYFNCYLVVLLFLTKSWFFRLWSLPQVVPLVTAQQ